MKQTVAKCVGLICAAKGRDLDENMTKAWLVVLADDSDLEPFLLQATTDALKASDWPTVHQVYDLAVEYAKERKRALRANQEARSALPAPSEEVMTEHRTKMQEAFAKVREKFDMKEAIK